MKEYCMDMFEKIDTSLSNLYHKDKTHVKICVCLALFLNKSMEYVKKVSQFGKKQCHFRI